MQLETAFHPEAFSSDLSETADASEAKSETKSFGGAVAEHTLSIYANKIYYVFASDTYSENVKNAIYGVLIAASNESGIVVTDDVPDIAKASFPVMMRRLNTSYQRAFIHSIDHILISCFSESELKELDQYEKRFESKKDASEVEDSSAESDIDLLAVKLSAVLNSPALPAKLAEIISDELIDVDIDTTSTEHIKHNLLNSFV